MFLKHLSYFGESVMPIIFGIFFRPVKVISYFLVKLLELFVYFLVVVHFEMLKSFFEKICHFLLNFLQVSNLVIYFSCPLL
jgi:hypothetical protein